MFNQLYNSDKVTQMTVSFYRINGDPILGVQTRF